ncbi:hypothetical protein Bresa_02722|uniref:Uncharacterized protein n=1 Tax=Brenneria salicis ATCC 15712 = DSM 30166 TaxID=714314 RepID=A0A366IEE1_9GAMM|nr:hypothetical protein [Brenneria salicis]NMN92435.1 hypothetical protein [Brenneria salicis ATCC 15712 = DSM 30166]RBP67779.1 hypothetical protein DES54_101302 [Brenneria salicis ATCC 15712 = DSM 30166]RLM32258.1 hypothetical protein BHG07_00010 [Brenneria salicis ATCC 15712 = DSM 30166]
MLALRLSNFIKKIVLVLIFFGGGAIIPILFVNIDLSYTKNNYIKYNVFTFDEIKKMPFISDDYIIYYESPDGTTPTTNSVIFLNVNLSRKSELVSYIENMGFQKYEDKIWSENDKNEFWRKKDDIINILQNDTENTISFSVQKGREYN